MHVEE